MLPPTLPFISCDWGTSQFRLRWVGGPAEGEVCTDDGTGKLAAAGGDRAQRFQRALESGLEKLGAPAHLPVVISGMASSSIGWRELPYAGVPFGLDGRDAVWERLDGRTLLISGLRSETNVLRGEETEAIGLAASLGSELPARAVFIHPGTHAKHLEVESSRVTVFRTYMTGELFDLLACQSVLRHSTDPAAPFDRAAFVEGVSKAQEQPLTAALFEVRTRQVLARRDRPSNTSFLSGLLIGAELGELRVSEFPVILAASGRLREAYTAAAETLGLGPRLIAVAAEPLAALGQAVLLRRILNQT